MAEDDLSVPLGQNAKKKQRRLKLPITVPQVIALVLGLFVSVFAVWALVFDDPLGGEPMAVIATGFAPDKTGPTMPVVTSPAGIPQGPQGKNQFCNCYPHRKGYDGHVN